MDQPTPSHYTGQAYGGRDSVCQAACGRNFVCQTPTIAIMDRQYGLTECPTFARYLWRYDTPITRQQTPAWCPYVNIIRPKIAIFGTNISGSRTTHRLTEFNRTAELILGATSPRAYGCTASVRADNYIHSHTCTDECLHDLLALLGDACAAYINSRDCRTHRMHATTMNNMACTVRFITDCHARKWAASPRPTYLDITILNIHWREFRIHANAIVEDLKKQRAV